MKYPSTYDVERVFLRSFVAREIADPLASFDGAAPCEQVLAVMTEDEIPVAAIRLRGRPVGYILRDELRDGLCGVYAHPFENALVLPDSIPLVELIHALQETSWAFIRILGEINGIITRQDLQDPPVRMWLFGLVTTLEMHFHKLIQAHYPDQGWEHYLSPRRVEAARVLLEERKRRGQSPSLLDCLQLSDKGQIIARDAELRREAGFASRNRADEIMKRLEALRNNLAHSQDIIDSDWEVIVLIAARVEEVLKFWKE
jgi:hypothetical protein